MVKHTTYIKRIVFGIFQKYYRIEIGFANSIKNITKKNQTIYLEIEYQLYQKKTPAITVL